MKALRFVVLPWLVAAVPAAAAEPASCPAPSPIMLTHTLPPYPPEAIRAHQQGLTKFMVNIGADGAATEVTVTRSSGFPRLDDTASAYIKRHYRWKPSPDECKTSQEILFDWHIDLSLPPKADAVFQMRATDYPPGAAERQETGDSYLEITIDESGAVKDGRVAFSSGYTDLDDAALALAKAHPGALAKQPGKTLLVMASWSLSATEIVQIRAALVRAK